MDHKTNLSVHAQLITFSSRAQWGHIEIPCTTRLYPGVYFVQLFPTTQVSNNGEMTSNPVEVRWIESAIWHFSAETIRMFSEPLITNISLYLQTACPQQEPSNINLSLQLNYIIPTTGDSQEVTSRGLVWPFGTTRTPINSSVTFPCQFFDRHGSYYATLSLNVFGRKIILDRSHSINASQRLSDYSLEINGDIRRCANMAKGAEGIRVSYYAPQCVGNDKIRLYKILNDSFNIPMAMDNTKKVISPITCISFIAEELVFLN